MIVPAVMHIEIAADVLKSSPPADDVFTREAQARELHVFGDRRAQTLGASGLSTDFVLGYQLGVETARVMLKSMPIAVQAGIEF